MHGGTLALDFIVWHDFGEVHSPFESRWQDLMEQTHNFDWESCTNPAGLIKRAFEAKMSTLLLQPCIMSENYMLRLAEHSYFIRAVSFYTLIVSKNLLRSQ
jgi:hypothetical protein